MFKVARSKIQSVAKKMTPERMITLNTLSPNMLSCEIDYTRKTIREDLYIRENDTF